MARKIEWNENHKSADEQQSEFVDMYLTWPPIKKWKYLMALASQGIEKVNKKVERRIQWK